MKSSMLMAAACVAAGLSLAAPACADEASDLATIKRQIGQMQKEYNARIQALEARLKKAEAAAKTANQTASTAKTSAEDAKVTAEQVQQSFQAAAETPAAEAPTPPTSAGAFNPGIAAVLNGFYGGYSHDPRMQRIAGFAIGDEARLAPSGFSLGESEISFAANIDPSLAGFLDISFDDQNQPSVEEAYVRTTSLPGGFTLKAGRFLSGIAYLNERHAHDWIFSDAPLPYRAFLNNQYGDDGVQLHWLAPTDIFLEFGAEWFRGDEFPAEGAAHGGHGTWTAYLHSGDDINESSSWLAALSYLHSRAGDRETENAAFTGTDHFTGTDDLGIASLVYKWSPNGNPLVQNFVGTTEFFYGKEKGLFDGIPIDTGRNGWYVQGDYQFMPQWSFGLRYAQLRGSNVPGALAGTTLDDFGMSPRAETALLEYDSSEFGRLRLQYSHDETGLKPNDEVLLQYTVIYGPHGAHRY
ncbi:MAG: TonB-dependent receptor [Rhizomicrobium sp.]